MFLSFCLLQFKTASVQIERIRTDTRPHLIQETVLAVVQSAGIEHPVGGLRFPKGRHGSSRQVVENTQLAYRRLATVLFQETLHRGVMGNDVIGMVQPFHLALHREPFPPEAAQVVNNHHHLGTPQMSHPAHPLKIFLERILQHQAIAPVQPERRFQHTRQGSAEGP